MRERSIGAWLVYDFRGSSGVMARLLPPAAATKRWTTRRVVLVIPASGLPRVLVHSIDASQFANDPVERDVYLAWPELHAWVASVIAASGTRIAMDYSPGGALPVVSQCDAGFIDLVRGLGAEVLSSADLIQTCIARWSAAAVASHRVASREVARIKDEAFELIRQRVRAGVKVTEYEVQCFILAQFEQANLATADAPVVAVNEHSADPHFEVHRDASSTVSKGDWVLIDLWARQKATSTTPEDEHIFSDITWVGFVGEPSGLEPRRREVFETVRKARDASAKLAQQAHAAKQRVQGWQLDDAARHVIVSADMGQYVRHRTGHSLSSGPMVHGLGVNLDNLETHDTREVIPGVGWTVEPGVYIPGDAGFGVRLEINMFNDPSHGPIITSCVQDEIVWCG